jgi:hypothetical protein
MDPPLCSLFRSAAEPMCPGLPGDPSGPETLAFITSIWLLVWLTVALVSALYGRWRPHRRPATLIRVSLIAAGLSSALIACFGLNILARNHGRWADLKRELRVLTDDLRDYEAAHGRVTDESFAVFREAEIAKGRVMTFSFAADGPEVEFKFRLWTVPPRVLISWGGGRNAGFDLDTMVCDYSD